jgi:hypothetical protein
LGEEFLPFSPPIFIQKKKSERAKREGKKIEENRKINPHRQDNMGGGKILC